MFDQLRWRLAGMLMPGESSDAVTREPSPSDIGQAIISGATPSGSTVSRSRKEMLDAYNWSPWLRAVVHKVAHSSAMVTWRLYVARDAAGKAALMRKLQHAGSYDTRQRLLKEAVRRKEVELEEITEHPLLELLHTGNDIFPGPTAGQLVQMHMDLVGEAFELKERNQGLRNERSGQGVVERLLPIPPSWVTGLPSTGNPYYEIRFGNAGAGETVHQDDIIMHRDPNPLTPYGRGSGTAGAMADVLQSNQAASQTIRSRLERNAIPPFIAMPEESGGAGVAAGSRGPSREQIDRIREEWERRLSGPGKTGFVHFLKRRFQFQKLGSSFEELSLIPLLKNQRDQIIQMYGMPPELMGIVEDCLDEQTECLTRRGWVRHESLTYEDQVATWNEEQGCVEYHRPKRIVRYDHDGPMHHWTGRANFMCTPHHRLWLRHGRRQGERGGWVFATSEEAATWTSAYWRVTGGGYDGGCRTVTLPGWFHRSAKRHLDPSTPAWRGMPIEHPPVEIDAAVFAEFLGYWIAEGWVGSLNTTGGDNVDSVFYSQNAGSTADGMQTAMDSLGIGSVYTRSRRPAMVSGAVVNPNTHVEFRLQHRGLAQWLRDNCGTNARTKQLPEECFDWPPHAQDKLLQALIDGDGSRNNDNGGGALFHTTSERLADDVQRLCVLLGYRSALSKPTANGVRTLSITINWYQSLDRYGNVISSGERVRTWVEECHYQGTVWCVEVPNSRFFTRRGGRVVCHGNSNRATISAAELLFARHVLVPRVEQRRAVYQRSLVSDFDERLILDYESPVPADEEAEREVMNKHGHAFTMDEIRERGGLPPLEDEAAGRSHAVPSNIFIEPSLTGAPQGDDGGAPDPEQEPDEEEEEAGAGIFVIDENNDAHYRRISAARLEQLAESAPDVYWIATSRPGAPALRARRLPGTDRAKAVSLAHRVLHRAPGTPVTVLRELVAYRGRTITQAVEVPPTATAAVNKIQLTSGQIEEVLDNIDAETLDRATSPAFREGVETAGQQRLEELGLQPNFDLSDPKVVAFLADQSSNQITRINNTTRAQVRAALAAGMEAGEDVNALARRVRGAMAEAAGRRSVVIARTESVRALNAGGVAGTRQAGMEGKQWLSTRDLQVRDTHAPMSGMDGQIRRIDRDFDSPSGDSGPHPGAFGTAAEVVNCRCTTLAVARVGPDDETSLSADKTAWPPHADTEEKRERIWRAAERTRIPIEKSLRRAFRRAFAQQERAVINSIQSLEDDES